MHNDNETPESGLESYVPKFVEDRIVEIRSLKDEKNMDSIQKKAHNWKGYSRPYGFGNLEILAREIESNKNSMERCLDLLDKAEVYCLNKQGDLQN